MEKKILVIVCVVMLGASYFISKYQDKNRKEKYEAVMAQEREERIAQATAQDTVMPFSPVLEKELKDFISDVNKSTIAKDMPDFRRLYYTSFSDGCLRMYTGYGYDEAEIKGFIRMDGNIIIYYGNPDNIDQRLIDESKLLTTIEQLAFYKDQYTISAAYVGREYNITDKENLSLKK